jgi:hypothetical protein
MNATVPPPSVPPSYRNLDFAYFCFACIALALCFGLVLSILPISQGDKEGYAMLLGIPIIGAFAAGIAGLVLSILYRSEWQLGAMTVGGVAFMLTWALDEMTMEIAAVCYTVVVISFFCGWFFFRRRKMKQGEC